MTGDPPGGDHRPGPSLRGLFVSFLRLGAVSFGGPAMVTCIRQLAVVRHRWLTEEDFEEGVALCQAVPGATAMQCAAYVGLRLRRLPGAVAAYLGFGLPAFALMLALAVAYARAVELEAVTAALAGLRALAVALVANAAWRFARAAVLGVRQGAISLAAALAFLGRTNPLWIVLAAGLAGSLVLRGPRTGEHGRRERRDAGWRSLRAPALLLTLAAALVTGLFVADRRLACLGLVMMKVDLLAFGGGFASVPLMFREVVEARGWMPAGAFMDGIALGQVTPGPIVITATFVGQQVAGVPGAVVATLGVFLPSLMVVALGTPWCVRLRTQAAFQGVSRGLVLSFVGLLASVTVQFARLAPWSVPSALIALAALVALRLNVDVLWVVLVGAVVSAVVL
ncbi:MAG: chromate efflux transporter [Candidatus Latescibacterota bacterium]